MSPLDGRFSLDADDPARPLHEPFVCLLANGIDGAGEALRLLADQTSVIEREQFMGVAAYERGEAGKAHANGFKTKTMSTRLGELDFLMPQVREGYFYPSALDRGCRSERAVNLALAEIYVQHPPVRLKLAQAPEYKLLPLRPDRRWIRRRPWHRV